MYLNFRFHPGRGREIQGGGGTRTCESWFWSLNNNQHKESIQATAEPAERLIPTFSSRSFCVAGLVNHWWREQRNGKTVVLCRYELVQGTKDILDVMIFFFYHWHLLAPNTSRRQGQKKSRTTKKNYCFISPQKTNQTEPSPLHKQAFIKIKPDARHHAIAIICRPAHHVVNSLNVAATSSSQLARRESSTASPRRALILSGIVHAVQEVLNVG